MQKPRIIRQETAQVLVTFPKVPVFVVTCQKCGTRVHLYAGEVWRWTFDHRRAECAEYACKPPRRADQSKSGSRVDSLELKRGGFDCSYTQKNQSFVASCKLGGCKWASRPGDPAQVVTEADNHFIRGHQKRKMVFIMEEKVLAHWLELAKLGSVVVA